mmetsp:Transcript_18964/g.44912  ORF Transcript_18964/g.44912 Transcript_18964/m.44912 type:complete len:388 (+) Transcript_18964:153-1316(+)|eukprot:CAMPEP_0185802408 /NCGR_PEP_ID=MMETSP1322-20130828/1986_1 /TAXON_ID=265543 /ORGANISM="Minutocellus polymorphus, Strain RCC2270" /LENGTH=387 /DNA_ID=CAMNT_0028498167 /DNA_START=82 /DNA_END=1245 /DNA_ORIENTATION=-
MGYFWDPSKPDDGPPARISQTRCLFIGVAIYAAATVWPPLILIAAFILGQFLPYALRVNDDPESRRRFYREFQKRDDPNVPEDWRKTPDDIVVKERYFVNDRGMCLMTTTMEPADRRKIKAVVCFVHGYGDSGLAYLKRVEFFRYIRAGIAVVNMEIEGHGRSDGMLGLVPCFERVVDDLSSFFEEVMTKKYPGKKCFLAGESMGGAMSMKVYNRNPSFYAGVQFMAPMCKLSEKMLPPDWVINLVQRLLGESGNVNWLGELPIAPAKGDTALLSFKLPEKRRLYTMHPFIYGRKPRLDTARECIDLTSHISKSLAREFDAPFFIQHGSNDMVTCPKLSQLFFDESPSKDKQIKIYEGMWHNLLGGEPKENTDRVFADGIKWILERA